ncbi:winged helix-turn-helix transcriptional regulator [Natronococcus wangiae]|uniref:winged helix-turn-helix transcriptional regulator n=1 Tax=Natronococcus wangiae TaxID=3068275 RepID=UPI00273EBCB1|nr:helix-turn-helix domain-containing protein [Natronococcus sp. AD5]
MTYTGDQLPTWCGEDEWCPMVATSIILGRKWHPVIIQRLLEHGTLRFGELKNLIPEVSGKVLSESLTDLEEKGLVERSVTNDKPIEVKYSLTHYGQKLEGAITELHAWGREYLMEALSPEESII